MIEILNVEEALGTLTPGVFIFRENRFTAAVKVGGKIFKAHVADTGRLKELLIEGSPVMLAPNPKGKLDFKLVGIKSKDEWVLINTSLHSAIAEKLINLGILGFKPRKVKREVKIGSSRFDFLVDDSAVVEVKGCNLVINDTCLFPDAPTERGKRHVEELIRLKKEGFKPYVLFLLLRRCSRFSPNRNTDPEFSRVLEKAVSEGLKVVTASLSFDGRRVFYSPDDLIKLV
jgi:sugar fermentation stimulation protein A